MYFRTVSNPAWLRIPTLKRAALKCSYRAAACLLAALWPGVLLSFHRMTYTLCICYVCFVVIQPQAAKLNQSIFHPFEVVSRYRDPQLQVGEKYSYLFNFRANICKS